MVSQKTIMGSKKLSRQIKTLSTVVGAVSLAVIAFGNSADASNSINTEINMNPYSLLNK